MNLSRTLAARRRVRPRVEALEDRRLLAVLVTHIGTTLNVTGTPNQAHTITIVDDGHGDIGVVGDGQVFPLFSGIKTLNVTGGKLNDTVWYTMTGPLMQTENVTVRLGGGNNKFLGVLEKDFVGDTPVALIGGHLTMRVETGPGKDLVSLAMLGNLQPRSSLDFATFGIPGVAPVGQEVIRTNIQGAVEPGSSLSVNLNAGHSASELLNVPNVSVGAVTNLAEHGGPGDDKLALIVHPVVPVNATIDGGAGFNEAWHTANVNVLNCAVVHLVP
jgi:hypothetical protein